MLKTIKLDLIPSEMKGFHTSQAHKEVFWCSGEGLLLWKGLLNPISSGSGSFAKANFFG